MSNVPGPKRGIIINGKKCHKAYPLMVPIGNFGMAINVYSMNGVMKVSVCSDAKCCKQPQKIIELFEKKYDEVKKQ